MNLTTATPAEIDAELAKIYTEIAAQETTIERARQGLRRVDDNPRYSYDDLYPARLRTSIELAELAIARRREEANPLEREYMRRGGWTRYYLVDANNGHVHYDVSNRRCSRRPSTRHLWLTTESGKIAEQVIEIAGEGTCTVCFPDAPVAALARPRGYRTPTEIEQEAVRAQRAQRKAARDAKAITNPDGTPLRIRLDGHSETLTTVAAAQRRIVDILVNNRYCDRSMTTPEFDVIRQVLAALAAKNGTTTADERAAMNKRYRAKCKREGLAP